MATVTLGNRAVYQLRISTNEGSFWTPLVSHLYTWLERVTDREKCPEQSSTNRVQCPQPGLK